MVTAEGSFTSLLQRASGTMMYFAKRQMAATEQLTRLDMQMAAALNVAPPRLAFVTLLFHPDALQPSLQKDAPLHSALALANSLCEVRSAHPLLLLHNYEWLPPNLAALHVEAVRIEPVPQPIGLAAMAKTWFSPRRWLVAYNKLAIWRLTAYDRLIYLDGDAVVTRSIDWLFRRPVPWATQEVMWGTCEPVRVGASCRSGAGWGFSGYGNGGLLGLTLSTKTFDDLLSFAAAANLSEVFVRSLRRVSSHFWQSSTRWRGHRVRQCSSRGWLRWAIVHALLFRKRRSLAIEPALPNCLRPSPSCAAITRI
jgi:hypothetical protein